MAIATFEPNNPPLAGGNTLDLDEHRHRYEMILVFYQSRVCKHDAVAMNLNFPHSERKETTNKQSAIALVGL